MTIKIVTTKEIPMPDVVELIWKDSKDVEVPDEFYLENTLYQTKEYYINTDSRWLSIRELKVIATKRMK